MTCPSCERSTRVLESRQAEAGMAIRRRRECPSCGRRFTTYERREPDPLFVIKRDGERQRFDHVKLRGALLRAAHKRPVEPAAIEAVGGRIEAEGPRARGPLSAHRTREPRPHELRA